MGSTRKDLHVIAIKIFQFCLFCIDNVIELEVQRIPRSELDRGDYISRIIDIEIGKLQLRVSNPWRLAGATYS